MTALEWLAVLLGVGVVGLIMAAIRRGEFDSETPKYEMLNLPSPQKAPALAPGKLSPTDRIVRLGLLGACFYYAARVGWGDPVGITLGIVGTYSALTGLWNRDPLYRLWYYIKQK